MLMNKNTILILLLIVVLIIIGFLIFNNQDATPNPVQEQEQDQITQEEPATDETSMTSSNQEVVLTSQGFEPKTIPIKRGDSVTWTNNSDHGMWVASAQHPTHTVYPAKSDDNCLGSDFDACASRASGESWSFTFDEIGSWNYHNHVFASEFGTVVVTE